ncbi:YsnF/AvaK domain-containing protein [Rhizobium leguminosarum]|uniref:YsnF/AvaK domain-containing protein n=1 Tax=Rhizobium leguminosarum TaxID=384 RepID=UPI001C98C129|nr:YsnF/AvaK domain-containing protein [Rhizobium leguminosarum]MBY5570665.1 YsnF/AvaK domain-containing protein [Rhizobium leguminosarum]MBY5577230.1 YsnF/AvaK domain-containing protein [Rhizobium leguminosarum]
MANLYNGTTGSVTSNPTKNNLSAFFDSRSDAERAVERLKDAGVANDAIRFLPGYEANGDAGAVASDDRSGFWAKLEDWFFPDEDRATYAEGLRRGGFLVSVQVDDATYETAHDILDDEGSIDIDERADSWRREGWDAQRSNEAFATSTYDASRQRKFDDDLDDVVKSSAISREDTFNDGSRDEAIPVVEENLRVGKRDVNNGSVRVRAYTVDAPVREKVSLRDENVEIERRTVDRPLTDADRAFQDRTIAAEEHHEEAVVSKDARVVEEIGLRKTASDRTETIDDSVRKTEVEVEDGRRGGQSQSQGGQSQGQGFRRD